ncbi:hypothetical protein GCM10023187_34010 [Nibrella viscosa]|uniref:YD repeat-containing protein n=1 Tax=Nibrella viscosa TaxID=1084524 RepID=A0ABP8KM82_9BACT
MDSSIPRIETPAGEIAYIRTKWKNGKHIETVLYDRQDRVLEVFCFGRNNSKRLNRYTGENNTTTISYDHSDSVPPGYVEIDTLRREFDAAGRVVVESRTSVSFQSHQKPVVRGFTKRALTYTATGDTLFRTLADSYKLPDNDSTQVANITRWERDNKQRLRHHYRLYVIRLGRPSGLDTIFLYSRRYAYDATGKLQTVWFDDMYLDQHYSPAGPDTVWYQYDSRNRLVAERHQYTTDMRNKREMDTTRLAASEKESIRYYRDLFLKPGSFWYNNRVDSVQYRYETFDPARHLPLKIPVEE